MHLWLEVELKEVVLLEEERGTKVPFVLSKA